MKQARHIPVRAGGPPFLIDGAGGTELAAARPDPADFDGSVGCNEILNATRPDLVRNMHDAYFKAGSRAVETNSFGGTPIKLVAWGLEDRAEELSRMAAAAAAGAARHAGGFVIGSLGPSGLLPTTPGYDGPGPTELTASFDTQASGLIRGGVDVLLVETSEDILELRSAILGCRDAAARLERRVPVWCTVSLHMNGRMLLGAGVDAAMHAALSLGVEAFGLNCATGPGEMLDAVRYLALNCPVPVIVFPNAGIPESVDGEVRFPMGPEEFAEAMTHMLELGVEVVGGCCGTTPAHIVALSGVLARHKARKAPGRRFALSSAVTSQEIEPEGSPLIIGERLNTQGSRKFRRILLAGDMAGIEAAALSQEEKGAQVLDVATALAGDRSEKDDLASVVDRVSRSVFLPLMIDSVDPAAIRLGLERFPGAAVVNSVNFENEGRSREVLETASRFGAAVVAMTIDGDGMARTAAKKLEVASKLFDLVAGEYGFPPEAILFDPLTFTLATGEAEFRDAAASTLEAVSRIRESFPGCGVVLGISNVSYGLPPRARRLVNAAFLHSAVKAGLTAAIVNPGDIKGYHDISADRKNMAEDLIFNRREDALERLIDAVSTGGDQAPVVKAADLDDEAKLTLAVIDRREKEVDAATERLLRVKPAGEILNGILLPAMKEVGDRMARSETILPHVLRSAEVMRRALTILEPHMKGSERVSAGKVVLATVFGDVHDIGKNLVKTILAHNGFEVVDLGKQVPARLIVEAVERERPLAVGLSALLVSTAEEMGACVKALFARGMDVPVIVGGAAVSPASAARFARAGEGEIYPGGVFYAPDAFAGLELCRKFAVETRTGDSGVFRAAAAPGRERDGAPDATPEAAAELASSSTSARSSPTEPAPGTAAGKIPGLSLVLGGPVPEQQIINIYLDELMEKATETGAGKLHRPPGRIAAEAMSAVSLTSPVEPVGTFGIFPVRKDGESILVETAASRFEFNFPRKRERSIADWLGPEQPFIPYLATLGSAAVYIYQSLDSAGRAALAHEWASLCAVLTETAAEKTRAAASREAGAPPGLSPLGFSPGYPMWTDLAAQEPLLALLGASRLGVNLTSHHQLVPEYSTTGIIILDKDARY